MPRRIPPTERGYDRRTTAIQRGLQGRGTLEMLRVRWTRGRKWRSRGSRKSYRGSAPLGNLPEIPFRGRKKTRQSRADRRLCCIQPACDTLTAIVMAGRNLQDFKDLFVSRPFVSKTSIRDSFHGCAACKHAQRRAEMRCPKPDSSPRRRKHSNLYDRATHGCARTEPGPLPIRLRLRALRAHGLVIS